MARFQRLGTPPAAWALAMTSYCHNHRAAMSEGNDVKTFDALLVAQIGGATCHPRAIGVAATNLSCAPMSIQMVRYEGARRATTNVQ